MIMYGSGIGTILRNGLKRVKVKGDWGAGPTADSMLLD